MLRLRPLAVFLLLALALCLLESWHARSQTGTLLRLTNTTDEGINLNPSISGDGRHVAFESSEDLARAGGSDRFRAVRADLWLETTSFIQMAAARSPAPAISQDGTTVAFAANQDPLGTNPDGNSEIFLYHDSALRQITYTTPADPSSRTRDGNFLPSMTDDGRFITFASNRNLTNQNADGNLEIFLFDNASDTFTQLTDTLGTVGATDAKISGDGSRLVYLRDEGSSLSIQRDLVMQDRTEGTARVLAAGVPNLSLTYGRAISDDGKRIVYAADQSSDSSQVFLYDARTSNTIRQITALGTRSTDVPLNPTISGDGTRLSFATRRTVLAFNNTDASIELYTFDLPTGQFARVTSAPSAADCFAGSTRVCEVVSSLSDDGSVIAFNFPRVLSGAPASGMENNSEIYVALTAPRPASGTLQIFNEAAFGHEPSPVKAIAPDSNAVAIGGALAFTTEQAQKQNREFPTILGGTTVTVNGRRAQISYVSPTRINFIVPHETDIGTTAEIVVNNSEGFQSKGAAASLNAAPGIFTNSGDGTGEAVVLDADTLQPGPFDPTSGSLRLNIFTTGVRHAKQLTATAAGRALTIESFMASPEMPGMDEVHVLVPADLRGAGPVNLLVRADGRDSNSALINFSGNACRDIVINELLADPPDGAGGDANRDGVRNSADDEFIELVNTTSSDLEIGGYQLLTRSSGATSDTVRHTFASGTIFPARSAIVIFGGGNFDPDQTAFGGAQLFKASSGSLSLNNAGGVVTLRTPAQSIINTITYGGLTGPDGGANQSLTRSPDAGETACGPFVLHTTAQGSGGLAFSPGTRADGSFFATGKGRLTSLTLSPSAASIISGQSTQFAAQARDQFNRPLAGIFITFTSDETNVATVDSVSTDQTTGVATALLTGRSPGTSHVTAQAMDGTANVVRSSPSTLTVREPPPVITRVEISSANQTINRGQTQQFTATAFDQNNKEIAGVSFNWSSGNTNIATVNANGLARGVGPGSTTIKASATDTNGATIVGSTMLNVQMPLVINEINADVAPDNGSTSAIEGDANRDGVRDAADDEFVELLNNSGAAVDLSGVVIADSTSNRFTLPANTILAAGRALVIFGGGTPSPSDPAFGGSLVLTVPGSGTLSLNDTGDTLIVKLNVGGSDINIAAQSYGGTSGINPPSDQSLTRAPDAETAAPGGNFIRHTSAANAAGRSISPGTRADGTPFGSPAITRIELTPASDAIDIGQTQSFTARAFSNAGGPEIQVPNVSFIWDSSDLTKVTLHPLTGPSSTATALSSGNTALSARAGGQQGTASLFVNPTLSINDLSLNEGNAGTTLFTFTLQLSTPAPAGGVTFNISAEDGTATVADLDYLSRSLTSQTIPAGSLSYTFDVTVNGDLKVEADETFFVKISDVHGATLARGQAMGTILNDDIPSLSINDLRQTEGDTGTTTYAFTVSSSLPAPVGGITFDLATQDGTATVANNDYIARSLTTQTIPPGEQTYTFEVTVNADLLVEPDETFTVNLANVSGAIVTDGRGQGVIQNDDEANLVISQLYGAGGNTGATLQNDFIEIFNRGTKTVDFSVTPYSLQYAGTTGSFGSNSAGNKTNLTTGTIAPGQYYLLMEASGGANGSVLPAPDATGSINMSATGGKVALVLGTAALPAATCPGDDGFGPFNPNHPNIADFVGYGSSSTAAGHCFEGSGPAHASSNTTADLRKAGGCIETNDNAEDFFLFAPKPRNTVSHANGCAAGTAPNLSINDVTVTEGNSGTVTATFIVQLSAPASAADVTFDIATEDHTATTANNDYLAKTLPGQIIPAGEQISTFTVTINGDLSVEPNETFFVNVTNVSGATVLKSRSVGTILNDDLPSLGINDVAQNEGNSGTTTYTFTIHLSAPAPDSVTFEIATADGTAQDGIPTGEDTDYQARSLAAQTIPAGGQDYQFNVLVNGDTAIEANETFFVNVSNVLGATISDGQALGTIQNDDSPAIKIDDVTVTEGNTGTTNATFTVTLSQASNQTITLDYATADGTAKAPADYNAIPPTTLTFNPNETSKTITVLVKGDTSNEAICETFFVNLSNPTNATVADSQGQGSIIDDDGTKVVISQVFGGGSNSGAPYRSDFIEIFNRGLVAVNLNGWSVQYASDTGATWSVTSLTNVTLQPGQYYLVQEAGSNSSFTPLPTPDATGTVAMAAGAGKVALVNSTTPLTGSCPNVGSIIDFIGYGTTASCREGTSNADNAPAPGNTTADHRKQSGCQDTQFNAMDFQPLAPTPRSTRNALTPCSCSTSYSSPLIFPEMSEQSIFVPDLWKYQD